MTLSAFKPGSHCEIDGIPVNGHQRCNGCRILIGAGHYDPRVENGLCEMCRQRKSLVEERMTTARQQEMRDREADAYRMRVIEKMPIVEAARILRTNTRTVHRMVERFEGRQKKSA